MRRTSQFAAQAVGGYNAITLAPFERRGTRKDLIPQWQNTSIPIHRSLNAHSVVACRDSAILATQRHEFHSWQASRSSQSPKRRHHRIHPRRTRTRRRMGAAIRIGARLSGSDRRNGDEARARPGHRGHSREHPDHQRRVAGAGAHHRPARRSRRHRPVRSSDVVGCRPQLQSRRSEVRTIPIDAEGLVVDALERELKQLKDEGKRAKLLYFIPNFQNPTGVTTTLERRQRIAALAREYALPIVEDDAYFDLRYAGSKLPRSTHSTPRGW